jgi:uncharacterized protein (TIGR02147 family)
MSGPKVFQYEDFRQFLKDYFEYKKTLNTSFTYGIWARLLKVNARSTLTMVLTGKREIGPKLMAKFIEYFQFSPPEAEYFRELILMSKLKRDPRVQKILNANVQRIIKQTGSVLKLF